VLFQGVTKDNHVINVDEHELPQILGEQGLHAVLKEPGRVAKAYCGWFKHFMASVSGDEGKPLLIFFTNRLLEEALDEVERGEHHRSTNG
jgi:hypothetical protein